MKFSKRPIGTITLPNTAGENDARIVIGPEKPAVLDAYFSGTGRVLVGGVYYYLADNGGFEFDVLTYDSGDPNDASRFLGFVDALNNVEIYTEFEAGSGVQFWSTVGFNNFVNFDSEAVFSGGVELVSGDLNVNSGTDIEVLSGGDINVQSGGDIEIMSGGDINVQSGGNINVASGGDLLVVGKQITGNSAWQERQTMDPGGTKSSGSFVNMPSPITSTSITKRYAGTVLKVTMGGTFYVQNAQAGVEFGVSINGGGTQLVAQVKESNAAVNAHTTFMGIRHITGIGAGSVTVQPRWARFSGTGIITMDVSDFFYMTIEEVSA